MLLIFSLVFYAYGEPKYIALLIATVLVDYIGGLLIDKFRGTRLARLFVFVTATVTLASLALFKYADFFTVNANSLFNLNITPLGLALPIGISFYTFQALTYVVDVYRGKVTVQKNFFKLLLYVSMFPQLIAGPIVRYSDVDRQLSERTVTLTGAASGAVRFCVGLLKKTIIANYAGELCKRLIGGELTNLTFLGAFVGILAFTIQIYFDFSAYSDMAIGLGKIFGFDFPENFNYPYCATSINDFWKRWHISLSSFFKDYVYIPLGGNRKHWAFNMLLVWVLTGFWHGASWNYVLWGLYYFFFLMLEKLYIGDALKKLPVINRIYSLMVIMVGWAFFYFEDMSRLRQFFTALGMRNGLSSLTEKTVIINYIVVIVLGIVFSLPWARVWRNIARLFEGRKFTNALLNIIYVLFTLAALLISTASLVGDSFNPFLYFRF
ncbi:MAG: MBOAT family O-acyltransferase [Clostridiaceae bacterium]|nr:MBOAT family O-acyltransferase [Clostridiaceae bacterium]